MPRVSGRRAPRRRPAAKAASAAPGIRASIARFTLNPALDRYWQVLLWFLLSIAFCFLLPVWFQRKFLFGAHVPLCLLAAVSVDLILTRWFATRWRSRVAVGLGLLLLPALAATSVFEVFFQRQDLHRNADHAYYISDDLMDGFRYLKAHSSPDDIVMASGATSRVIPVFAGNTVLWGHWALSIDFNERAQWVADVFDPHADLSREQRARKFWDTGVHYIFADGALRHTMETNARDWQPILDEADCVFTNRSVEIFKRRAVPGK
jgi:hypothetical protein